VPGFKFGRYQHFGEPIDPDDHDRSARPDGAGPTVMLKACIFTNSPDEHFIIDRLPDAPQVSVAAGFSGQGYKFCSVIGEIMADLAIDAGTRHDIDLFRLERFGGANDRWITRCGQSWWTDPFRFASLPSSSIPTTCQRRVPSI